MIKNKNARKPYKYVLAYVVLFMVWIYLSDDTDIVFDEDFHTLTEIAGSILSIFISVLAYVRYFTKRNNMYLFISTGFLVEGSFKGLHAILTLRFIIDSIPPNINTWIFIVSRIVFPTMLLLSYFTWKREKSIGNLATVHFQKLYSTLTILFFSSFIIFLIIPEDMFVQDTLYRQIYHLDIGISSVISKIPIFIYLLALFFYLKKGDWKYDEFEHWLIIYLIFGLKAETILEFAHVSLDILISHIFRDSGYLLLLLGLIITMYKIFKRAEESAVEIKTMNNSLSKKIYERHDLEKSLKENEERYRLLVEHSPDLIAVNTNGKWSYINTTGRKMLGATCKQDIVGRNVFDFVHPDDQEIVKETIGQIINKGRYEGILERRLISLDNRIIHTEIQAMVTDFQNQLGIMIMARDITERKKTEELLRRSEKLTVVGEIAAGIAHEIRNPLTSLNGFIQLIQHGGAEKTEYYKIMLSELSRIENIISELLILGEPQSFHKEKRNVCGLLDHVIALFRQQATQNNIQIVKDSDAAIPLVLCEEAQLKQVFINIVKNAFEAMPTGGQLSISLKLIDGQVCIRFVDQGTGIPPEILVKLGQPFITTKEKGTGLGLMVTRRIIENHQGSLEINSTVGQGTTIDIYLPA